MTPKNQARIRLRKKLIDRDLTVKELAQAIGHPRETVSKAIHHGRFPRVLKKVEAALA